MNASQQMIAIFPLPSEDFVVLFKDSTSIQWCAVLNTNNSYESKCETNGREILIECSHNWLYVILIIVVILALVVIIPILCWTLYTKLNFKDFRRKPNTSQLIIDKNFVSLIREKRERRELWNCTYEWSDWS